MTPVDVDVMDLAAEPFCCPGCRSELSPTGAGRETCPSCGHTAGRLAVNFVNFLPGDGTVAREVLEWPDGFVDGLDGWVSGEAPGPEFDEQLTRYGLTRPDGGLTPLGEDVHYHVSEYRWQAGRKGLDGVLDLESVGGSAALLDVGCGAGQTLRRLEPDRPVELFGVDVDLNALALGQRLARRQGVPLALAGSTAYRLPFPDGRFDLVLTRVALNYMHQRTALAEMVRVLRPGGYLFCRVERVWHDVSLIARARSVKALVCRCRDLGYGTFHALTGLQGTPGSLIRGGRAFASAGRLGRTLGPLGCQIVRKVESPNGPLILGRRTQLIVVARKGPAGRGQDR